MKPTRFIFFLALGTLTAIALLELCLQVLPTGGRGVYAADIGPDWPVHHLIPHSHYTHSSSWNFANVRHGETNNMGYVAPFDYTSGTPGILIFGDSFVESLMNNYGETLQGQLPHYLRQPAPVLNFGTSGMSLADYMGLGSLAAHRFQPEWAVILIVKGDFLEGFSPADGYFGWDSSASPPVRLVPAAPKPETTKVLRQSALVRYLRYNLRTTTAHLLNDGPHPMAGERPSGCRPGAHLSQADMKLLRGYVEELPASLRLPASRLILIFDSDREAIYSNHDPADRACPTRDFEARQFLRDQAMQAGVNIIDTEPIFRDYYRKTDVRVDYSPFDLHWNGTGHRLVAEQVARIINAGE